MTFVELRQTVKAIGLVGCLMIVCIFLGVALAHTCDQPHAGQPTSAPAPAGDPR